MPSMPSLAQQLKQLEAEGGNSRIADPESAYSSIDALELGRREGDEGREHYLDVGPSRLRAGLGVGSGADQTLLSEKYGGKRVGRMKIFDDDEDEDEDEEEEEGDEGEEDLSEEDGEEDDNGEDDDEEEEEGDGEEEDDENDDGEEEEEGQEAGGGAEEESTREKRASRILDPLAALKESRAKDIETGKAVRAQKASSMSHISYQAYQLTPKQKLFESLLTMRITFQKAITASSKLPTPLPADPEEDFEGKREQALLSLAKLNERLSGMWRDLALPGVEVPENLGKRKRDEGDELEEGYWANAGRDSLAMTDATEPQLVSILNKWSNKIQAATLQMGSKQAGGSKFMQSTKDGSTGIMEAIEAGLASKRESVKSFLEHEDASYRTLLREVIESRAGAGAGAGADVSHLRREKKKKREAERGASKGRKIRYTVHEKAQNFVVPTPLRHGWHEEQVDELFSSLLGGVGLQGAGAEASAGALLSGSVGQGLQGLRVL